MHESVGSTLTSKKKRIHKNQQCEINGRFRTSKKFKETHQIYENFEDFRVKEVEKDLGVEESLIVGE